MDKTGLMVEVLKRELCKFSSIKGKFVDMFSLDDYEYIEEVSQHTLGLCLLT